MMNMTDLIRARHTVSGKIAEVPRNIFEHDVLGAYLEEVGPDAKPYLPEMHRVSLPANPTEDQILVAQSVGVIDEVEAKLLRKQAEPAILGTIDPADTKDKS
jgi:hypothetical protein